MTDKKESRTEELRNRSDAVPLSNRDHVPFVRWPEENYAYVEGRLEELWEGIYGPVARISVHKASEDAEGVIGSGDEQYSTVIEAGDLVNLNTNYAAFPDISESQIGKVVHVAFTGWGETRDGNRYRQFEVIALGEPEPSAA